MCAFAATGSALETTRRPHTDAHRLFEIGRDAIEAARRDDAYLFRRLARLPADEHFLESSYRGSRSPLRIAHMLLISMLYRRADDSWHQATIRTRLRIASVRG